MDDRHAIRVSAHITHLFDGHAFATDEFGVTYFILPSHFEQSQPAAFADLRLGSEVLFTPIQHPKGKRAIEILLVRR